MKRTELSKTLGMKIAGRMKPFGVPDVTGGKLGPPDRREQRKLDQAAGLVPFACKLNSGLVAQIQALAKERGAGLNETVAELLAKGLAQP